MPLDGEFQYWGRIKRGVINVRARAWWPASRVATRAARAQPPVAPKKAMVGLGGEGSDGGRIPTMLDRMDWCEIG